MTRQEAIDRLSQAASLIFDVEAQLTAREYPRQYGYKARIEVGNLINALREERDKTDISKPL